MDRSLSSQLAFPMPGGSVFAHDLHTSRFWLITPPDKDPELAERVGDVREAVAKGQFEVVHSLRETLERSARATPSVSAPGAGPKTETKLLLSEPEQGKAADNLRPDPAGEIFRARVALHVLDSLIRSLPEETQAKWKTFRETNAATQSDGAGPAGKEERKGDSKAL